MFRFVSRRGARWEDKCWCIGWARKEIPRQHVNQKPDQRELHAKDLAGERYSQTSDAACVMQVLVSADDT